MIVVRIEMWPKGFEAQKYPLGEIRITNVGGDERIANYGVIMKTRRLQSIWRTGTVMGFKKAALGPYDLLLRALIVCIGNRAPAYARQVQGDGPLFEGDGGETCP